MAELAVEAYVTVDSVEANVRMIADRIFAKLVNDGKNPKIRTGKSWAYYY